MSWKKKKIAANPFISAKEESPVEKQLFLSSVIAGMLISALATIVSIIIASTAVVPAISATILATLSLFYYFAKIKGIFKPLVMPLIFIGYSAIFTIWIFDGGINGSNILVAFVILILSLIIAPGKRRKYVMALFVSLLITIYLIQLLRPDLIRTFENETIRWIDSLVTAIYSSVFIFFIIRFLHNHYSSEKKRAEEGEVRLQQLNSDKDRFISILSHDLRTPFNAILGFSEILAHEVETLERKEIEEMAGRINKSARNTYNLLEDILLWASMQSSRTPFSPGPVLFGGICHEVIESLSPAAEAKGIVITCAVANNITIEADANMLKIIMRNLVSNAIKFSHPGGTVAIEMKESPGNTTVSVTDNGTGIKPDKLATLFEITSARSATGTAGETGTGLGLLLCKEFVEKHNGHLWVTSEYGQGSQFTFSLPGQRMSLKDTH
jgi:signal transduction histidine kinase